MGVAEPLGKVGNLWPLEMGSAAHRKSCFKAHTVCIFIMLLPTILEEEAYV